ncbi:MAG TPA: zf-HC2 domain-containing protein [Vicinamibacteria bacterium]|nr:zf-HC2 domain-containing protein [Vicinamibacteria bacterium]
MDCPRAEELFSDHLEGTLHPILRAELESHLEGCAACRTLRGAFAEAVQALHAFPEVDAPSGLAERVARAAVVRPRAVVVRPAIVLPSWFQAAAAGVALIVLGTILAVVGPEKPTRAAQRLVGQTLTAGNSLRERKDRLVEDVRLLGVVLGTAFEGRLERVNERVEDYRRLLDRKHPAPEGDSKRGAEAPTLPSRLAGGFRTGPGAGA